MASSELRKQFGKRKEGGGGGPKVKRLKGEDAAQPEIYRVLPPMKSLADEGKIGKYHAQHFGYKVENKADGKLVARPFGCVRKKDRSGLVTVECEEDVLREEKQRLYDDRKRKLENEGRSEEEVKSILQPLYDWTREHSLDGKWYIGVKCKHTGEFSALAIPHKMKKELDKEIDRLQKEEGIDAVDIDEGVWLHFKRTGKRVSDMNFAVEVYMEEEIVEIAGKAKKVKSIVSAPLSDEDLAKALNDVPDLVTEVVRYITPEQVKQLARGSGDPDEVERILFPTRESSASTPAKEPTPTAAPKQSTAPTPPPPAVTEDDDEEAALLAALAAARAKKAAAAAPAPATVEPKPPAAGKPGMAAANPDDMSDDEFAALYGE